MMTDPTSLPPRSRRERALTRARIAAWLALAVALISIGTLSIGGICGLVLIAASVLLGTRPGEAGHRLVAVLALGFALFALVAALRPEAGFFRADWPIAAVLLVGSGSLVVGAFGPRSVRRVAIGVGGFTLSAVACTAIFVRVVGSFDLLGPRTLGSIPAGLIAATLCLGVAFLLIAWSEEVIAATSPNWVPAAVGIAGVIASLFLWRALVMREQS